MRTRFFFATCLLSCLSLTWSGCGEPGGVTDLDGGATFGDTGVDPADGGGEDAGPAVDPGEPCAEGAIAAACACEGERHATGYCCNDLWFDPAYDALTGGCPDTDAFRYVDPAHGAANDDGAGAATAPWATIEHGVATVMAGQVLVVAAGTYEVECTGSRYTPALNPGHSGTPGAPVVLKARGEVVLTPRAVGAGTARGGSTQTIVLAEHAASEDQAYTSHYVRIVGGTGAGQSRLVLRDFDDLGRTSYEGATRTAWVNLDASGAGDWETAPDATSEYELVRTGPVAGTLERQHVVWDGFTVVERDSYHADTGPVVLWASSDVVFMNGEIEATSQLLFDNHNALRIEGTTRAAVRNNRIHGVLPIEVGRNNPQNHAAIMIYSSEDALIEHNEIHDSYTGLFPKGGDRGHLIRWNHVHDCTKAIRLSYHDDVRVEHNLLTDNRIAFQAAENLSGIRIANNTVLRSENGLYNWFPFDGVALYDNLFSEVEHPVFLEGDAGSFEAHHNAFHGMADFVIGSADVGGLAAWQAGGWGEGSIVVEAPFVDAEGGDLRLAPSSPAATAASHGGAVGAYLTGEEHIGLSPER